MPIVALLAVLLGTVTTPKEVKSRREELKPRSTDEQISCGQAFVAWDAWGNQPAHEEQPLEIEMRKALEECVAKYRKEEEERRAAASAPPSTDPAVESRRLKAATGWSDAEVAQVIEREQKQRAANDTVSANTAEMERLKRDPAVHAEAVSAWLCWFAMLKQSAQSEIAKDKKYAREGGGAIDLSRTMAFQQQMRAGDEGAASTRARLKRLKAKAASCSSPRMVAAADCIRRQNNGEQVGAQGATTDPCDQPFLRAVLEAEEDDH